jgi:hypothetical protein
VLLVTLADDLSVPDQLKYLGKVWQSILPACEVRLVRDSWEVGEDTRESSFDLVWPRAAQPAGEETVEELLRMLADLDRAQGYEMTEEEKLDRLRETLERCRYDATDFETSAERQERIAKTQLHGEARTQQFIELHQQGLSIGEISCETDWSWEVVRLGLRKAGVTAFNNHRNKPGLTWEPSDASEGSRANG